MGPELSSNGLAVAQSSQALTPRDQANSMITAKTTAYRKGLPQSVLVYVHVCTGHSCNASMAQRRRPEQAEVGVQLQPRGYALFSLRIFSIFLNPTSQNG